MKFYIGMFIINCNPVESKYSIYLVNNNDNGTFKINNLEVNVVYPIVEEVIVKTGEDITITIIPNKGYNIGVIKLDDYEYGKNIHIFDISNIQEDHSIEVTFEKIN